MTGPISAPTVELGSAGGGTASWWAHALEEITPELQWPHSVSIYDRMGVDSQIASVLRAVTLPVLRTEWRIRPAGARDEVVEHVAHDLGLPIKGVADADVPQPRTRDRFSWTDHLRLSFLDLTFGHSFFEQVARVDERGRVRLRKLAPRLPNTIAKIQVAADGGLEGIEQYASPTAQRRAGTVSIPVSRLVAYTHDRRGGDWTGRSLLRAAYRPYVLKDRIMRVQAQTIERNGMGIPLYTDGTKDRFLDEGEKLARQWRSGATVGAAVPNGAKLELVGVQGTLPDAEPVVRYYDEQIARTVLAHALNLGTQTGSWALGSTFMDFFVLSLQSEAEAKRAVAQAHVVEDLVDWNWGPDEPAPQLEFEEIGSRHPATAAAIKLLVDAGLLRPDGELEQALRQRYGLPPADDTAPAAAGREGAA